MGEYMDVTLNTRVDPIAMCRQLQATVPDGFDVFDVREVPMKAPSLMSAVAGVDYAIVVPGEASDWQERIDALMSQDTLEVERRAKRKDRRKRKGPKIVDIRPMIRAITVEALEPGTCSLRLNLDTIEGRGAKGREVRTLLDVPGDAISFRLQTRFIDEMPLSEMASVVPQGSAESAQI
jgi:radical SAM-linked protein